MLVTVDVDLVDDPAAKGARATARVLNLESGDESQQIIEYLRLSSVQQPVPSRETPGEHHIRLIQEVD